LERKKERFLVTGSPFWNLLGAKEGGVEFKKSQRKNRVWDEPKGTLP